MPVTGRFARNMKEIDALLTFGRRHNMEIQPVGLEHATNDIHITIEVPLFAIINRRVAVKQVTLRGKIVGR